MRAALALGILLVPAAAALGGADPTTPPGDVTLRIEGRDGLVWRGTVPLGGTVTFAAAGSGQTHTIDAGTPLGVLLRAAGSGALAVAVTDAYLPSDFLVLSVADVPNAGAWWWDSRVALAGAYYGDHFGWLANGPALRDGDEVLWYLETTGSRPLRVSAAPAGSAPDGAALVALQVAWALVDERHRPCEPWPPHQRWVPAHAARIVGDAAAEAPGGAAVLALPSGTHVVWAEVAPSAYPTAIVRSAPLEVRIP